MLDAERFAPIQRWVSRVMSDGYRTIFLFCVKFGPVGRRVPSGADFRDADHYAGVWREARAGNSTARALWWVYVVFNFDYRVAYAQGFIDSVYLANYCIIALIVLKSNQLGQEHSDALVTAEALSRDLQTRVDERTVELERAMLREVESTKSALRKNLEMAELGRHVATIGHELHNPIGTTIALQSQLERDLDSVSEKLSENHLMIRLHLGISLKISEPVLRYLASSLNVSMNSQKFYVEARVLNLRRPSMYP